MGVVGLRINKAREQIDSGSSPRRFLTAHGMRRGEQEYGLQKVSCSSPILSSHRMHLTLQYCYASSSTVSI